MNASPGYQLVRLETAQDEFVEDAQIRRAIHPPHCVRYRGRYYEFASRVGGLTYREIVFEEALPIPSSATEDTGR